MRSEAGRAVRRALKANGVTRRRVLAGAATLPLVACAQALNVDRPVAVIGGGLAGLVAALTLADAGFPAQVYEASERLGGRVKTSVIGDSLLVEEGAEFIDADHIEMLALCRRFNLALFNRAEAPLPAGVPRTAYWMQGRRQDPVELERLLAPLARRIDRDLALLDEDEGTHAPRIDALSAKAYLDAVPLDPRARWMAETTIRSEYGVEPEDSSALQLVYSLPGVDNGGDEPNEAFTIANGNQRLAQAIAAALPLAPLLDHSARSIRATAAGFLVEGTRAPRLRRPPAAAEADWRMDHASAVIVALPPLPASFLTITGATPPSPPPLGSNEKAIAAFADRPWLSGAFSAEAMIEGPFTTLWDATLRQQSAGGAVTGFIGGRRAEPPQWEADLRAPLLAALREAGGRDPGAPVALLQTNWSDGLSGGAYASFRPGEMTNPNRRFWGQGQTAIDGRVAFAGEHLSESHYGFMEGAVQTGRMAAEAIIATLQG